MSGSLSPGVRRVLEDTHLVNSFKVDHFLISMQDFSLKMEGVFVARNDQYRKKASAVNHKLKDLYKEKNLHYIDHSNLINTRHLNGSKLHLNIKGAKILFSNLVEAISNILL